MISDWAIRPEGCRPQTEIFMIKASYTSTCRKKNAQPTFLGGVGWAKGVDVNHPYPLYDKERDNQAKTIF